MSSIRRAIGDLVGSTVGEFAVLRQRKQLSAAAIRSYEAGEPARIGACVYGLSDINRGAWVGGELLVEPGRVVWFPGRSPSGAGVILDAAVFQPDSLRQITSRESWAVTPGCISLRGEMHGRRIEIAVLEDDIVLLLDSLRATRLLD